MKQLKGEVYTKIESNEVKLKLTKLSELITWLKNNPVKLHMKIYVVINGHKYCIDNIGDKIDERG